MKNEIRSWWKVQDGLLKLIKHSSHQIIVKFYNEDDLKCLICDAEEDDELISHQGKMISRFASQHHFYHASSNELKPYLTVFVTNLN